MAMAVVYTNFGGQIVHENRGGVERRYIADPLGSTIALTDSGTALTDTWDYWPYGEVMTRTGSNPTPFTFVGTLGYFKDLLDKLLYVRARHYQPNYGRWLTVDPLSPGAEAYEYSGSRTVDTSDPSGLFPPNVWAGIIAALTSCLINAVGSVISGWWSGDSPRVAACKAGVKCLTGALRTGLAIILGPVAGCIASIIGAAINAAADKFCPCIDDTSCDCRLDWCDVIKGILDSLIGCVGGFATKEFIEKFGEWLGPALESLINTIARGAIKNACKGGWAGHPPPVFGRPR